MVPPKQTHGPAIPAGPIVSLVYRVSPSKRTELISFLQKAVPFYEQPGGIKIGLYESMDEPGLFLEMVAYETQAQYEADQLRVEEDKEMKTMLKKWHEFIEGSLEVRRMKPVSLGTASVPQP